MALLKSRILKNEFMNKGLDVVPEHAPLVILDIKSAVYMANNGKDTKHNRKITEYCTL